MVFDTSQTAEGIRLSVLELLCALRLLSVSLSLPLYTWFCDSLPARNLLQLEAAVGETSAIGEDSSKLQSVSVRVDLL